MQATVHMAKKKSDFPPCGKLVIFVTEFVIFFKTTLQIFTPVIIMGFPAILTE